MVRSMRFTALQSNVHKPVLVAIGLILLGYFIATLVGWTETVEQSDHIEVTGAIQVAHFWSIIPFTLLLAAIAVLPLLEQTFQWWERNLNKFYVAVILALIALLYLSFLHPQGSLGRA